MALVVGLALAPGAAAQRGPGYVGSQSFIDIAGDDARVKQWFLDHRTDLNAGRLGIDLCDRRSGMLAPAVRQLAGHAPRERGGEFGMLGLVGRKRLFKVFFIWIMYYIGTCNRTRR